ncbi:glycosyltransferase family 4 protein [Mangrovibacillus cuniculi]|uniref:Glycosyltransferase family 1 protein n=1 Tax=Mangrovibacillus cuniculi TaxID=2593652 RepID=A0A7S8HGY6_9BACI|nr:glycosyltransferase family 1 protein [Mangrovibacillus cuniculi]QPC47915.1 glycosyltransferase family 1 protein [Mangrovibacillus cuniculi]
MRVALFTDTYFPQVNGVARTLKRFVDHMGKRGIQVELFVPEMEEAPVYPNTHQFTSIPFVFYPECRTAIANPAKIQQRLRSFRPDIIHVATPLTMGLYGAHAAKKLGIPLVGSYHTHFDHYLEYYKLTWLSPLLWRYMKWFHAPFERIFVPSEETKNHLDDKGFENLSIWSRGVEHTFFHPQHALKNAIREQYSIHEKYVFTYVGRIAPEKDLETLENIIKRFPLDKQKDVHWVIVGNGPSYDEFKQSMSDRTNVTLTGYMSGEELAGAYAGADAFVFPSPTETFGNVVLEALACGTPSFVANSGGVAGIVQHHKTGAICEARNAESFIGELENFMDNPSKQREWSLESRAFAKMQSWDAIFDQLLSEYEEVLFKQPMLRHA